MFEDPLSKMMSAEEEKVWLVNVLEREMEVEDNVLHKYDFMGKLEINNIDDKLSGPAETSTKMLNITSSP